MIIEAVNKQGARITTWQMQASEITAHHLDTNARACDGFLGAFSFSSFGIATYKGDHWTILEDGQFIEISSADLARRLQGKSI